MSQHTFNGIPAEICAMGAGADSYLREILFPCLGCGVKFTARHLYGESDLPGECADCAGKYFTCATCGGYHHPEDGCAVKGGEL